MMKKWEDDRNKKLHIDALKNIKSSINTNSKQEKRKKNLKVKNHKSPSSTQKYFAPNSLISNKLEDDNSIVKDTSQVKDNSKMKMIMQDVQGGEIIEEIELSTEQNLTKLNSFDEEDHASFQISGSIENITILPIFKLLQAFKLQQYAKALTELGFGFEVYKLSILGESRKYSLINKLNLMPGHRARFIDFFDTISKVSPQDEIKSKSNQRLRNEYVCYS